MDWLIVYEEMNTIAEANPTIKFLLMATNPTINIYSLVISHNKFDHLEVSQMTVTY